MPKIKQNNRAPMPKNTGKVTVANSSKQHIGLSKPQPDSFAQLTDPDALSHIATFMPGQDARLVSKRTNSAVKAERPVEVRGFQALLNLMRAEETSGQSWIQSAGRSAKGWLARTFDMSPIILSDKQWEQKKKSIAQADLDSLGSNYEIPTRPLNLTLTDPGKQSAGIRFALWFDSLSSADQKKLNIKKLSFSPGDDAIVKCLAKNNSLRKNIESIELFGNMAVSDSESNSISYLLHADGPDNQRTNWPKLKEIHLHRTGSRGPPSPLTPKNLGHLKASSPEAFARVTLKK